MSVSIHNFIGNLSNDKQRRLFDLCHHTIIEVLPHSHGLIKYRIPFYRLSSDLCYLNPYLDHLYIGFIKGKWMMDRGELVLKGTINVAKYYIPEEKFITNPVFTELLLEAALLDEMKMKNV